MTDRVKGFVVTLQQDVRADDAEQIAQALRLLRGVVDVRPVEAGIDDLMNRARLRAEYHRRLLDILEERR